MKREEILNMIKRRAGLKLTGRRLLNYLRNTLYTPLTVAYGLGVDSTAILIRMYSLNIRPDLILFSDTGSEKPETYAYLDVIQSWLREAKFPPVTIIRRNRGRTSYDALHDECLTNRTLPAISMGMKSCSVKWKIEPFNRYISRWHPALRCWDQGGKVVKAIGFDAGPNDGRRMLDENGNPRLEEERYIFWYPLIEWGLDREACKQVIRDAGLPVPVKSACFMCGSMRRHEIDSLDQQHPDLMTVALRIEAGARPRLKRRPRFGLNRQFSWAQYLQLKKRQTSLLGLLNCSEDGHRTPLTLASQVEDYAACGG